MRAWPVLLLLLTALSGCTGGDGGSGPGGEQGTNGVDRSNVPAAPLPEWRVGDYWGYSDNLGNQFNLVVAGDSGTSWDVRANDKQIARFDALFDISFVGPTRKSDLAGQQGTEPVKFYDFPLVDGKSWMTPWDGESRHVTVDALEDGTFYVLVHAGGNENGDKFADYVYDPLVGHFSSIAFYEPNGTVSYAASLTDNGHDFTGTLYQFGATEVLINRTVERGGYHMEAFTIPDETGEMNLLAIVDCRGQQGAVLYAVQAPQEDGSQAPFIPTPFIETSDVVFGEDQPCPDSDGVSNWREDDPRAGTWRFDAVNGHASTSFVFQATWTPRTDLVFS